MTLTGSDRVRADCALWAIIFDPRTGDRWAQGPALVSTEGSIDWFCAPRFDSPSVFGALLDKDKGGYCRIRPAADAFTTKQLYFPDTAVLVTRYLTEEGVGEVIDFMPVTSARVPAEHHRIVRMLRCIRGQMTFDIEIAPRFDYGREPHETQVSEGGVVFRGTSTTMAVSCQGAHVPQEIILTGVRWYVAYPLSTRHVEERNAWLVLHCVHSS